MYLPVNIGDTMRLTGGVVVVDSVHYIRIFEDFVI